MDNSGQCELETKKYHNFGNNYQKNEKSNFLAIFKHNIMLWKNTKCPLQVCKLYITGLGFIYKKKISFCFIFILFDFMVDKNYDGNYYLFDFNKVNKWKNGWMNEWCN